jgi:hypothetical protein
MSRSFQHITVERQNGCHCVRLRSFTMDETALRSMFTELLILVKEEGCRRLALSLGPGEPKCLYSVFLAKLITLQRVLREQSGRLFLCDASEQVRGIFRVCQLENLFHFVPDFAAACAAPD